MENKENIKRLVDDLASINRNLDRKPGAILTPLQVDALEKTLYQNSGIKVEIQSRSDFKQLEEYYRSKLMLNNDILLMGEGWIKADKPIDEYPVGTKYRAIGGGHWTKLDVGRYKWCTGNIYSRIGGDWSGYVMLPKETNYKITFETKFNIGDRVKITIGEELSIFCRISAISYVEKITFENEVEKECCYGLIPENKNYGEFFAGTYFTEERIEKT